MGALINLRHIVTNSSKEITKDFVQNLLMHSKSQNVLRSNIYYTLTPNHLKIEYVAKSIPEFIYKNSILSKEEIITIYSSDVGGPDSFIIFNFNWNQNFNYTKIFYDFDRIEITGDSDEICVFQENLYRKKMKCDNSGVWNYIGKGKTFLHTHKHDMFNSGNYPNYQIIEEEINSNRLIENNFEICSLECSNEVVTQKLNTCLHELFNNPEYYGNKIESVKIYNSNEIIVMAKFDKEIDDWQFYQNSYLWNKISNFEIAIRMKHTPHF